MQGVFVTVLSFALVVLPSVESAYQLLSQMSTILYLILCAMIYMAFIRLRRTQPNVKRGFRIPGGKFVEWLIGIVGIAGVVFASVLSFFPPSQINTGNPTVYVTILIVGVLFFFLLPLVVYARRRPSWKNPASDFYPFDWQIENREPSEVSKWPAGYQPTAAEIEVARKRDAMEIADWISSRDALLNTYHDVQHMQQEMTQMQSEIDSLKNKEDGTPSAK